MLKILIIGAILVVGAIAFQTQLEHMFPNSASVVPDALQGDVAHIASALEDQAASALDTIVETAGNATSDIAGGIIDP